MKKNIWILNHYASDTFFDEGGRHYWFAKYLKRKFYSPVVFCANSVHGAAEHYFDESDLFAEHMEKQINVPYVFVRARKYIGNGKARILNMLDFYFNVQRAVKAYAREQGISPDMILASSAHPLTLVAGIQLAKYFGIPCICEVRDLWPESLVAYGVAGPKNPAVLLLRRLEKWIYRKSDAIVFTMEGAYDYIIDQGWEKDIPRSKVHFINNGVDLEVFDYNKEHYRIEDPDLEDPDIFKVVYTGSIRKVNNLGTLLDAAKLVTNPKVRFLVWGDGDELLQLQQRVKDEKIGNIIFKGRVEKKFVPHIVSCADLNIAHNTSSPILKYGISFNKLFDYFAAGKPILCDFASSYNPAVILGAGISTKDTSAKSIAQAIDEFSGLDQEKCQTYQKNAENAAKTYSFEQLTRKLLDIIAQRDLRNI